MKHPSEIIQNAMVQAKSLQGERLHRGTGLHADDGRIPCEIASTMFELGKIQKDIFRAIDSHHTMVQRNFLQLAEAKAAYELLQTELDICNFQIEP